MELSISSAHVRDDAFNQVEAREDVAFVERVRSGDMTAFDALVHKYQARVYGVVYHLTSNREDAADLAQETFVRAFRSLEKFNGKSSFFTWLYRIALNLTVSALRKKKLRNFFSFETIDTEVAPKDIVQHLSAHSNADRALAIKELQEKLNEAMQKLSPEHRAVVALIEIEGLSSKEAAEILTCSEGTVRSRLHYAKEQLQSYLKPYVESHRKA